MGNPRFVGFVMGGGKPKKSNTDFKIDSYPHAMDCLFVHSFNSWHLQRRNCTSLWARIFIQHTLYLVGLGFAGVVLSSALQNCTPICILVIAFIFRYKIQPPPPHVLLLLAIPVSQNSVLFFVSHNSFLIFVFLRIPFHFCCQTFVPFYVSQNSVPVLCFSEFSSVLFSVSPIGSDLSMKLTEVNFTSSTISHVVILDFLCLLNGTSG